MIFAYGAFVIDLYCAVRRGVRGLWRALPGDLLGLLVLAACGVPRVGHRMAAADDGTRAILVAHPATARYFDSQRMPVTAQTLGRFVISRAPLTDELLAHEFEHVRQWERLGPAFLPAYSLSSAIAWLRGGHPYRDNRFEVAARRRAAGGET